MDSKFMNILYNKASNIIIENRRIDYTMAKEVLFDSRLDFCLLSPPITGSNIESIPLEVQRMVRITSKTHRFADVDEIPFSELANENFAAYTEQTGPREDFDEKCHRSGFIPDIIFESSSIRDMINPVKAEHGIVYVSLPSISTYDTDELHVINLKDEDAETVLSLSLRNDKPLRHLVEVMKNTILEYYNFNYVK